MFASGGSTGASDSPQKENASRKIERKRTNHFNSPSSGFIFLGWIRANKVHLCLRTGALSRAVFVGAILSDAMS
jgi:hypothetical protein